MTEPIIAYKAFDKDLKCRGYQYEVGETYTHNGPVIACESGFHSCLSPFDCWKYYDLMESRFAIVEAFGETKKHSDDSKVASAEITIKAELSLPEFIKAGVDWLIDATKGKDSSGYSAKIGSSGDSAQIGSSGYSAQIGSSGNYAQIGSSGNYAQIGSSGYYAQIGSSGDYAKIGSSGYSAQIGSSGYSAKIGSSGDYAKIGSSGDYAKIEAMGENSVIASAGINARVKGATGTWISVAEYKDGKCVGFATGCIGKGGLEPDTFYVARDGNLVAA